MKTKHTVLTAMLLAAFAAAPLGYVGTAAAAGAAPAAAEKKEGWYHSLVDLEFVKKYAVVPKQEGHVLIDSRPAARKYDLGHIPTAINIPDMQFDKHTDKLPADKSTLLIFYCEGVECMLSHQSAFKAEKLGYTNVKVYPYGFPEWVKSGGLVAVSPAFIKKQMDDKAAFTLVDSRPKARKYDKGHIPGAINIPDMNFDKMTDQLPADKNALLIFYCDGLHCALSNQSAEKATKLGYTNVKVMPEGYPGWVKAYGEGVVVGAAPAAPAIEPGKEKGSISVASFEKIFKEAPDSIMLVDVREPREVATGTFKGAVNIPIGQLEKQIDKLPANKPIVFFCGAGGRSGEAYDMVKMLKSELKLHFLDAQIQWKPDGSYTIKAN